MTLTNDPFRDLAQTVQGSAKDKGESASEGQAELGQAETKAMGSAATLGKIDGLRLLTPPQREARLAELKRLSAQSSSEALLSLYDEMAWLLFLAQNYSAAVAAWDESLALQPEQPQVWYNRGIALDHQASYELALASYKQVIKLEPGNHIAWGNRAIALRKLGRDREAKEAARIAFELNPEDMVDSFFNQLKAQQPKLNFVWKPLQGIVQRLRR